MKNTAILSAVGATLRRYWLPGVLLALVLGAVQPAPAQASPVCVSIPVTTPGVTICVGDQCVRIPSVSDPGVCVDAGEFSGAIGPRICGDVCVAIDVPEFASNGAEVTVSFEADGDPQSVSISCDDLNGVCESISGPDTGICASVGRPADEKCFIHISIDPEVLP